MSKQPKFVCSCCGACCMQLPLFGTLYQDLDRGDGICKYFSVETKLCTIYNERPLKCRVEEGYDAFFSDIPYAEYIEQTYAGCAILQKKLKEKEQKHGGAD